MALRFSASAMMVAVVGLSCSNAVGPAGFHDPGGPTDVASLDFGPEASADTPDDSQRTPEGVSEVRPEPERCGDKIDNDGDGQTDDFFVDSDGTRYECCATPGDTEPCYPPDAKGKPGLGICKWGTRKCTQNYVWGDCKGATLGMAETCNNEDDDCDGVVDNGASCGQCAQCVQGKCVCSLPCESCQSACVDKSKDPSNCGTCGHVCGNTHAIASNCVLGVCSISCEKGFANCNGLDVDGCEFELAQEVCGDGKDNDCDGHTDDRFIDQSGIHECCGAAGTTRDCYPEEWATKAGVGECARGKQKCLDALYWSDCSGFVAPKDETCNCLDDDCDGDTDEADSDLGCTGARICDPTTCSCTCPKDWKDCGGACRDIATDPGFCGEDCTACPVPAGAMNVLPVCQSGICGVQCVSGFVDCNNDLQRLNTDGCEVNAKLPDLCGDMNGDGSLDDNCNGVPDEDGCLDHNATCTQGCCQCSPGYTDCGAGIGYCDNEAVLCVDVRVDPANCGYCGHRCAAEKPGDEWYPHDDYHVSSGKCDSTACAITKCDAGWADKNQKAFDGCECQESPEQCNGQDDDCDGDVDEGDLCDYATTRRVCQGGACGCTPPFPDWCPGLNICVDLMNDAQHCGYCDIACSAVLPNTVSGKCVLGQCCPVTCGDGFKDCNGDCQDGCEFQVREEDCNGLDDNCNGQVDESFPGQGQACDSDAMGICRPGKWACANGQKICVPIIAPGSRVEQCNSLDDDCDGVVDNGLDDMGPCAVSGQKGICADGYYSCRSGARLCIQKEQAHATDDLCDGLDNDCDGATDEDSDATGCRTYYWDNDGDGYGDGTKAKCLCRKLDRFVAETGDDCDDSAATRHPGAKEICNNVDDNCDGAVDENLSQSCTAECGAGTQSCLAGAWQPCVGTPKVECVDYSTGAKHCTKYLRCPPCPSAPVETCNNIDDNCDGNTDEGVKNTYYRDADGDGYGDPGNSTQACTAPAGYVSNKTDCNDSSAAIHPGATDVCNGKDDDCDGRTDYGAVCPTGYTCSGGSCKTKCEAGVVTCNSCQLCQVDQCVTDSTKNGSSTGCSTGKVCYNGTCTDKCSTPWTPVCGECQSCSVGSCVSKTNHVSCSTGSCYSGSCITCAISAKPYWKPTNCAKAPASVQVCVATTGCVGKSLDFMIEEYDLTGDDYVTDLYTTVAASDCSGASCTSCKSWTATFIDDGWLEHEDEYQPWAKIGTLASEGGYANSELLHIGDTYKPTDSYCW